MGARFRQSKIRRLITPIGTERSGLLYRASLPGGPNSTTSCSCRGCRSLRLFLVISERGPKWPNAPMLHSVLKMVHVSNSQTRLGASFAIKSNGEPIRIETIGQAYRFITNFSSAEWLEFWSLHGVAKAALEAAAENGMLTVQATNALRALFIRAKLL
jgi:hypothetical protein